MTQCSPEWISVLDELPAEQQWVEVLVDHRINPQTAFLKQMFGRPLIKVVPAQLRSVDIEGWAEWEQMRLASGHPMCLVDDVTMWRPLSDIPEDIITNADYKRRWDIDED